MTDPAAPLELGERTLVALFRDALRLYLRHAATFLAVGFAVVVPAELIVSGFGLRQFGAGLDEELPDRAAAVPLLVHALVTTPLVAAMTVAAVRALAEARAPAARSTLQAGLDAYARIFWPMAAVVAAVGVSTAVALALTLEVGAAFGGLILVPLLLYLRSYFVPHAVIARGSSGAEALRESWRTTRGLTLRAAGVVVLAQILLGIAGQVIAVPLLVPAQSTDSGALVVVYSAVSQAIAAPAVGLVTALLYFDLRARRRAS